MTAAPGRNGPSRPGGPFTVPSGICTNTAPASTTARAARTWPSTPTPPRHTGQQAAEPMGEPLAPACGERRRAAAEEPSPGLHRQGVHDHERVHPASVGAGDQEIPTGGQVLLARRLDPEPEQTEQHEPDERREQPVEDRRARLRLRGRASRAPRAHRRAPLRVPRGGGGRAAASPSACPARRAAAGSGRRRGLGGRAPGCVDVVELEVVVLVGVASPARGDRLGPVCGSELGAARPGAGGRRGWRSRSARTPPRRSGPSGCRRCASSRSAGTRRGSGRRRSR